MVKEKDLVMDSGRHGSHWSWHIAGIVTGSGRPI